jgi:ribosomal protein L16/L10AE
MKNITNIKKIYKKTQKGTIPLSRKSGYFHYNEGFALNINKAWNLTPSQLKALKLTIAYLLPKKMKKLWTLPPEIAISKREASRMGKGKGKVFSILFKFPPNFKFFETWKITNSENNKIKLILKNNFLFSFLYLAILKISLKYPFFFLKLPS